MNIKELRGKVEKCWSKSTSFVSGSEGSRGQCYVTALLVRTLYGGKVYHGHIKFNDINEHHFWNEVDGVLIDLTSDQYGGDGLTPVIFGQEYTKPLNFKNKRYLKLLEKYNALDK